MEFSRDRNFLVSLVVLFILAAGFSFILQKGNAAPEEFVQPASAIDSALAKEIKILPETQLPKKLISTPDVVKAIYVTGWSAGNKSYLNYLTNVFKTTEINTVVIDVKDYSGLVSYLSGAKQVKEHSLYSYAIPDIDGLIDFLHEQGIYVIARISVFEDPIYSMTRPDLAVHKKADEGSEPVLWVDNNKLSWLDPASLEAQDYIISIAKDAVSHSFDEINFDYIRFPSDGDEKTMDFPFWDGTTPMRIVIKDFFQKIRNELSGVKISVDLFGQTTINNDDMGIGQIIEDSFNYFDYVSPMVYPSHYVSGFIGYENPAEHPYEVVRYSMERAIEKEKAYYNIKNLPAGLAVKFRPWLQDFDMGADYTADMVKQEIKALRDVLGEDYNGFMLWNPSNVYTLDAVKLEELKSE